MPVQSTAATVVENSSISSVGATGIINATFPVGAVYLVSSNTNPGTLLGAGSWSANGTLLTTGTATTLYVFIRTA